MRHEKKGVKRRRLSSDRWRRRFADEVLISSCLLLHPNHSYLLDTQKDFISTANTTSGPIVTLCSPLITSVGRHNIRTIHPLPVHTSTVYVCFDTRSR